MALERIAEVYARYEAARRRRRVLDLDDLLWVAADLREDDRFAAAVRWRHRHLYVDEMQDLNEAQFRLLRALVGPEPDLFVVGDPNQSVYAWNGADPGLLDRVPDTWVGTRVLRLDANHRCSPQVVRTASAVLAASTAGARGHAAGRPQSTRMDGPVPRVVRLASDDEEAAWVARQVWLARRAGRPWAHIALLARTNAQLARLAEALRAERVPVRAAGSEAGPASDLSDPASGPEEEPDASDADEERDAVILATFHRAKGLEWPIVFVVGLSDGIVPLSGARTAAARDEERRLLYVALSRAERELTCTWAERPAGGADVARRPSPWLAAVEREVAALAREVEGADPERAARHLAQIRAALDQKVP
jgi:DNA helicase-2/ATP-dependent DNA helicase PcrA